MIQGKSIALHYSNRRQNVENWLCTAVSIVSNLFSKLYFPFAQFNQIKKELQCFVHLFMDTVGNSEARGTQLVAI